ncbi:MaoC family dehydratase [Salipiger sp. 1_MG-2023]|uniref:MaoC family dehydratase n=1 Tax=Salipiger sp. 1_MG-2023 TaxID=3062665 RepID=UPI0026E4158D|nr:MaoC family dehydratase [Salipiger sp. 1_MG-2023]MDO6585339.1 MaoC family dehydratase [Salipiger sp. 1_MG-2023]
MTRHYLEDLTPGQVFHTGTLLVERADVLRFAAEFDPQPFHLDDEAGRNSLFGGLAASGWHTAAMTMRLYVTGAFQPAGGSVGAGMEELRWPRPVFPGDTLRAEIEILSARASATRPERGIVRIRCTTFNQHDAPVQIYVSVVFIATRQA